MRLKVLIVDDELLAREHLRTLLGDCSAPTASVEAEAAHASQASEWFPRQPAGVALTGVDLPGPAGPGPPAWRRAESRGPSPGATAAV